jgi:transketolase
MLDPKQQAQIEDLAWKIRYHVIEMTGFGKAGHIGGSCSAADMVAALYGKKLRHDPKMPRWTGRDRFVMSKGHAALAQYAALAEYGYFPLAELKQVKKLNGMLQGQPGPDPHPWDRGQHRLARSGIVDRGRHGARAASGPS